jgi:hypothetical protein
MSITAEAATQAFILNLTWRVLARSIQYLSTRQSVVAGNGTLFILLRGLSHLVNADVIVFRAPIIVPDDNDGDDTRTHRRYFDGGLLRELLNGTLTDVTEMLLHTSWIAVDGTHIPFPSSGERFPAGIPAVQRVVEALDALGRFESYTYGPSLLAGPFDNVMTCPYRSNHRFSIHCVTVGRNLGLFQPWYVIYI